MLDPYGVGIVVDKVENFLKSDDNKPLSQRVQESFHQVVDLAKTHPGSALGALTKGAVADPELFFLPELGAGRAAGAVSDLAEAAGAGARTAEVAGKVAGGAARVGGAAGIGGGAEFASELGEDRPLDPGAIAVSAGMGALAAPLQVKGPRKLKLSPDEIEDMLAPAMKPADGGPVRQAPKAEVTPSADGYLVRVEGEAEGKSFATRAEAEEAKRSIEELGSAFRAMSTVPRGTSERSKLVFENPFTAENMAKWVKRPSEGLEGTQRDLLKYWGKAAVAAGIGAGVGAAFDRDDRSGGAAVGALMTLLPRALPRDKRLSVEDVVNARNGTIAVMARKTLQFKAAIDAAVPESLRRNAISLAMEKHEGITLNPTEAKVAESVRTFFDAMGSAAVDSGVLKEMLHDYVTHIVEDDPYAKTRSVMDRIVDVFTGKMQGGGQPSGKQFAQHRRYATLMELHEALRGSGLKIKTGDIGEIMSIYSRSMFKAVTDRRLIEALKIEPVQGMRAEVIPRNQPVKPPEGTPGVPARAAEGFKLPDKPAIGATAQRFAERQRDQRLLMPIDKIDANYTMLPNRQLAGYAVHKDIAPQLNFIFNATDPFDVTLGLMALNQASKRVVVSFSLFHAKSLYDAFVGDQALKAGTPAGAFKKAQRAVEMFKRGGNNEGIDTLLRHGLQLHVPEDVDRGLSALHHISDVVDKALPVSAAGTAAKTISKFNDYLDHFTFGTLQTGFKLITGLDAYERLLKKGLSEEAAGKAAASYANDLYGSLDWFRVANDVGSRLGRDVAYGFFNPNGRRWSQLLVFAPDWTISTFRAAYKALPGAVDDPALAALHRRYLAKSALYYLTVANAINIAMSGHSVFDNENPTRLQLKDGRTMQFSKHFQEPFEWMRSPLQTAANKLAFLPREAVQQITGKEYISVVDAAPDIDNRAEHLASQFLPIMAQQGLAGGGAESALGLAGMPIYGKDADQKAEARKKKKLAELAKKKRAAEYYRRVNQ